MRRTLVAFSVAVVALVAVLVYPSPYEKPVGGVVLHSSEARMGEYGPVVPENIVGAYTQPVIQSGVLPEEESADSGVVYVYTSKDQENYHTPTCQFAYASGMKVTLYEANFMNKTPGRCCDAPAYTGLQ